MIRPKVRKPGKRRHFRNTAPARTIGALLGADKVAAWKGAADGCYTTPVDRVRAVRRNYALSEGRL